MVDGNDMQQHLANGRDSDDALIDGWIPPTLLADTVERFRMVDGRPLPEGQAIEILANVKRWAELVAELVRMGETEEAGDDEQVTGH